MQEGREAEKGLPADPSFYLRLQGPDHEGSLVGQVFREREENPVERANRLQRMGEDIKTMRRALETTPHRPGLGEKGLDQSKFIHDTEPLAGLRTVQDLKKFLAQPLGCYAGQERSPVSDCLDRGLIHGKVQLSSQPDSPQEPKGVFAQQRWIIHPDPPRCQVSQAVQRIDKARRLFSQGEGDSIDREVSALEVVNDTPSFQGREIHLYPLPSPWKDNTADPSSKADYCTGKLLLKGRTQARGIGGDEVDVESPRTLQKGISEESAHEEDRQMAPLVCHPRYLPEQGMMLKGCKDG
jgi:hypothetical protein